MDRRGRFAISKRDWRNAKPITSDWPQGAADADGITLGVASAGCRSTINEPL
jgi:hypothetical protein